MLISLRRDHKEHLQLLTTQQTQVIVDFCKLSIDFLQNGPNHKRYILAADKLEVEVDNIKNCIYGLVHLLLLSIQHKLSDDDFRDSVLTLGFSQDQQLVLSKFYVSKKHELEGYVKSKLNEPRYYDLKWRFEAQISSRSLLEQATPLVSMELSLKKGADTNTQSNNQTFLLQTDPNNLLHLTNELERALKESKSRHTRKIQRILYN